MTSSRPDVFVEIKTRAGGKPFPSPDPKQLRGLGALGVERTIEQDPAFALRMHRICTADRRDQYPYADRTGIPRVEIPGRTWAEHLQLAVTEIRTYGAHSVQVCRRLRSLLNGLLVVAAPDRRDAIQAELSLLDESIAKGFPHAASLAIARASDPQGIGAPTMEWRYMHRGRRH